MDIILCNNAKVIKYIPMKKYHKIQVSDYTLEKTLLKKGIGDGTDYDIDDFCNCLTLLRHV
jgi:hypothetical protein